MSDTPPPEMAPEMAPNLDALERAALAALAGAEAASLEAWRVAYLGRKGALREAMQALPSLGAEARRTYGARLNAVKASLEGAFGERQASLAGGLAGAAEAGEGIDVTLPARPYPRGHLHPVTLVLRDMERVFRHLGFDVVEGPQVEWDAYNFEKLRIPADHPARDMWDTLWVDYEQDGRRPMLLRTHTSPMQVRYMESHRPPVRVVVPGTCYRYEATDATHEWMLTQVEGLVVDRGVTFTDMKGTLEAFVHGMFGREIESRFRCDYFPFVEPGAEVAIRWKDGRWIELLGAGMVHPEILASVGYDPSEYTGFAFGIGVERTAMLRYGIDDIRHFYQNDLRFLEQF